MTGHQPAWEQYLMRPVLLPEKRVRKVDWQHWLKRPVRAQEAGIPARALAREDSQAAAQGAPQLPHSWIACRNHRHLWPSTDHPHAWYVISAAAAEFTVTVGMLSIS